MATAPSYLAAGSLTAVITGSVTPDLPLGWAANDIFIMVAGTNQNNTIGSISGWTEFGTQVNNTDYTMAWFWRRAVSGDSSPTFTTASGEVLSTGNALFARIYAFRGCATTGVPFEDATIGGTGDFSATVTTAEVTSTVDDTFIVSIVTQDDNLGWASGMPPSGWTNLGGIAQSNLGFDSMVDAIGITKGIAGTQTSVTMGTLTAGEYWRTMTFALKPLGSVFEPPSGLTVTSVSATQNNLSWGTVIPATGYDIERNGVQIVTDQAGTTYSDTGLTAGVQYTYRVRSVSG